MRAIRVLSIVAVLSAVVVSAGSEPARAAAVTTPAACAFGIPTANLSGAIYRQFVEASGLASVLPGTAPTGVGSAGLDLISMQGTVNIDTSIWDSLWLPFYSLSLLNVGANTVQFQLETDISATNTLEISQTLGVSIPYTFTILDPDGIPGTGDEATVLPTPPMSIDIPSSVWTPTGGDVQFAYESSTASTELLFGFPIQVLCESAFTSSCSSSPLLSPVLECSSFSLQSALPFTSISPGSSTGSFGSVTCTNSATGTPTNAVLALSGSAPPVPVSLGTGSLTLSSDIDIAFSASESVAMYDLGLGVIGVNSISIDIQPTVLGTGTAEPGQTLPVTTVSTTFSITDPDGTPGTGDETGTPILASAQLPDTTWTPTTDVVQFTSAGAELTITFSSPAGTASLSCQPGFSLPIGCDSPLNPCTGQLFVPEFPFAIIGVDVCDSTLGACAIQQIITQVVIGAALTAEQSGSNILMGGAILDGTPQVVSGSIHPVTITNARGDATGWTLSGYVTDFGAPGAPLSDPDGAGPALPVPDCGSLGGPADARCIPGDNLAWTPTASVAHNLIAGDVAAVNPGPAIAPDAATWLNNHTAGTAGDGLGGLGEINVLCGATASQSGGTFVCDADLFLAIPASAAAATYTAVLVLTLL